jgi:Immunity protein 26
MSKKRQRRREGDVVEIEIAAKLYAYARVLPNAVFAFYDVISVDRLRPEDVMQKHIAFKVPVMNGAVTSGRWAIVGSAPLSADLLEPPAFFVQDPLHKDQFSISLGGKQRRATIDECKNLERLAVWSAEHIEDRLRDAHAHRPNKWVESLRLKSTD